MPIRGMPVYDTWISTTSSSSSATTPSQPEAGTGSDITLGSGTDFPFLIPFLLVTLSIVMATTRAVTFWIPGGVQVCSNRSSFTFTFSVTWTGSETPSQAVCAP
jgi:hypothetical protein